MLKIIDNPHNVLKRVYGYDDFRDNQLEIINAALNGKDTLGVMTTGGGKSVCFQVPALCVEGTTLVISPIISLMKDQVDRLRSMGVRAGYVTGNMTAEESARELHSFGTNQYRLFYVSPERLATPDFKDILRGVNLSFLSVDEAHCVSVWGHDFRPAFKHIKKEVESVEEVLQRRLPRLAFTATATDEVRADITKQLGMNDPFTFVGGFDRTNIQINVRKSFNKNQDLQALLEQLDDLPTIVYCSTVKAVESIYADLNNMGIPANMYHGRMEPSAKNLSQEQFLDGSANIMIATNAFGMGIDKSDIRHIIHYQMPGNIENYFQEAGRAGRDGEDSKAFILYNERDENLQNFFVENSFPDIELIEGVRQVLYQFSNDGVVSITPEQIIYAAPSEITDFQVSACLRILDDQGVIDIRVFDENYKNLNIEIKDISKALDEAYLEDRKRNSLNKIRDMKQFCETQLCRRRFVLRYFGEKQRHQNCGNCDKCIDKNKEMAAFSQVIPQETLLSVMKTIVELGPEVRKKDLMEVLMGTNSLKVRMRNYDRLETFGKLKHMTVKDVESLLDKLQKEMILTIGVTKDAMVGLTKTGNAALTGKDQIIIDAGHNFKASESATISTSPDEKGSISTNSLLDTALYEKLERLRKTFAKEVDKPPLMICSDKSLKLMSQVKPTNSTDLNHCGLKSGSVKLFGQRFINNIQKHLEGDELTRDLDSF